MSTFALYQKVVALNSTEAEQRRAHREQIRGRKLYG
jgi:hypothetical protein